MAEVMKQLSEADQLKFLATVNEAIAKMPISEDEKVARYVEANTAAVKAAANRTAMLAEIFATASPAALAVINEKFAPAIFDPSKQLSAEEKKTAAEAIMKVIESTVDGEEVEEFVPVEDQALEAKLIEIATTKLNAEDDEEE